LKVIILAAGEGKRLRPLTNNIPKALIKYKSKSLIDYQLSVFKNLGIDDIIIVKGYKADTFNRSDVKFVINENYESTNMVYSLFCANQYFSNDMIISYGDIIFESSIVETLIKSKDNFSVTVSMNWLDLWKQRMKDPLSDAESLIMDSDGYITELGKKVNSYSKIQAQYMGLFRIRNDAVNVVNSLYKTLDRNSLYDGREFDKMHMTSFIQQIINQHYPVKGIKITGQWLEIDRPDDLTIELNKIQ